MEKILIFTPIALAFGYLFFYMLWGQGLNPKTFRYNTLFDNAKLVKHLIFAFCFFIIGIFRLKSNPAGAFYFVPLIFILLVRLFNPLFQTLYNRNIIIATKWDYPPRGKKGIKISDRIIGALILLLSMISPIILMILLEDA
ncbi:hypothetical protein [Flavobacterium ajazii]|uniref:hypothetical protein n=1 Tax=Flavobacterium ajazii TaxID=2692318 RepID=UPI0013D14E34|nr:hypothetical protein [Flavobacterium ajazii]